jgi:xanthine dehydrogenase YagS FAD-binding subunit
LLYELPDFEYFEPSSIEDAVTILHAYGEKAKVLAGGTDLLGLMKDRISGSSMPTPEALVNVKKIAALRAVHHDDGESVVGAAITLAEIVDDEVLKKRFAAFSQSAASVGTNQIRNMGTLGGNLCQRPWCWYFRHPSYDCFKKGGKQCYAITGRNSTYFSVYDLGVCVMAHPSDTAPALVALDATANVVGPTGSRTVAMQDFFASPSERQDHVLKGDELLVSVTIPMSRKRSVFLKQRIRNNWDFSLVSVAAVGQRDGDSLKSIRVVLGGVAPRPFILPGIDGLILDGITQKVKEEVERLVAGQAHPLRFNRYKLRITRTLVLRALGLLMNTAQVHGSARAS